MLMFRLFKDQMPMNISINLFHFIFFIFYTQLIVQKMILFLINSSYKSKMPFNNIFLIDLQNTKGGIAPLNFQKGAVAPLNPSHQLVNVYDGKVVFGNCYD